jgi:uncharacterized cofD-like protein
MAQLLQSDLDDLRPVLPVQRAPLRVVAIGGGTGLSTLLRGFKHFVAGPWTGQGTGQDTSLEAGQAKVAEHPGCMIGDLAAVVTVTDDGGSSGRLRKDFNMLPPGDLRNCMVALSEDEHLISRLFQHRFRNGGDLEGHSFGNLFLAALSELTGDFTQAIKLAAEVLATKGHIYPATAANVTLAARMDNGELVLGETNITGSKQRIVELMLQPSVAAPLPETLEAIAAADLITMGPGSLYTSLITNLLVEGIPEALGAARGTRIYVGNLMTQGNESLHLTASQHIERMYEHARRPLFDYALINVAPVSAALRERYAAEGAEVIAADAERVEAMGIHCITGHFAAEGNVLRHNADVVAETALRLALIDRAAKQKPLPHHRSGSGV